MKQAPLTSGLVSTYRPPIVVEVHTFHYVHHMNVIMPHVLFWND